MATTQLLINTDRERPTDAGAHSVEQAVDQNAIVRVEAVDGSKSATYEQTPSQGGGMASNRLEIVGADQFE